MNIEQMHEAFQAGQEVAWDVFGRLYEDDGQRVHIEIRFTAPGEAARSLVDDREMPKLAEEAWKVIEADGGDDHLEGYLAGFLVGHLCTAGVPA